MVVVVEGNVPHHVKREGELSTRGKCPVEYVQGGMYRGKCPDPGCTHGAQEVWRSVHQQSLRTGNVTIGCNSTVLRCPYECCGNNVCPVHTVVYSTCLVAARVID